MSKLKNILIASTLLSLGFILFVSFSSIDYSGIPLPNSVDIIYLLQSKYEEISSYNKNNASKSLRPNSIDIDSLKPIDSISLENSTTSSNTKPGHLSIDLPNSLHLYQWFQICQNSLSILNSWPLFPNFPFSHISVSSLSTSVKNPNSAYRIFGFLIPPSDGKYVFACNKINNLELWISTDESPSNLKHIAIKQLRSNELDDAMIKPEDSIVNLRRENLFYMEFYFSLRKIDQNEVSLFWLLPGEENFRSIDNEYFGATSDQVEQTSPTPDPPYPPYIDASTHPSILERKFEFITLPYLDLNGIDELYEECEYMPSFAFQRPVGKYKGVEMIAPMVLSVFPDDATSFDGRIKDHNHVIPKNEADAIFDTHTKVMHQKWSHVKSVKLVNLEAQRDPKKGNRYLIDSEVVLEQDQRFRFTQFIYSPTSAPDSLCQPKGFNYQSEVFVHIAISVKNQGHWLKYFIENIERLYRETKDEHFGIIVIDFDSEDVDVETVVNKSLIPHKVFVHMGGRYERASSLNKALAQVESADEIVYTCDLHLELPNDIIESIRKHTIQGFSGYAPVVFRLDCGRTCLNIGGFWENLGYGLFSMYKSDWDKVGAFDADMFKDKWGGEDWDLVDRFISKGYFMDRMKQSYMFHFHHDRSRLW